MFTIEIERSRRQLLALVTAIRPSIIWRIDCRTQPLDLLDDNGIAGWRVGVEGLLRLLDECHDAGARDVHEWLVRDLQREELRWQDPQSVLTQALEVFETLPQTLEQRSDVLEQWLKNVDAGLARFTLQQRVPTPFAQSQATRLREVLSGVPAAATTCRQLARLAEATPTHAAGSSDQSRCVPFATRDELRVLGRWLSISAAAPKSSPNEGEAWWDLQQLHAVSV